MPPKKAGKKKKETTSDVSLDDPANAELEFKGLDLTRALALEKVEALNSRIENLKKENDQLKARLAKSEKDTHEFVAYFQREMENKDAAIATLKDEMMKKESEFRMSSEQLSRFCEQEVLDLKENANRYEMQLKASLKMAEEEVAALAAYRDHKSQMEQCVLDLQNEVKANEAKHIEKVTQNERKFLEEKAKMQRDLERNVEDMKQAARIEAQTGLDMDTRKVILDNRRMAEELRFQIQMMGELQTEKRAVENRNDEYRRQIDIQLEKEQEYSRQRHSHLKEIKQLKEKVLVLQARVDESKTLLASTKEDIIKQTSKNVEEHALDAQGLRQLLLLKNKELRQIRQLAQTILDQRTEVEQYFLDALAEVKQKIKDQRMAKHRQDLAAYKQKIREAQATGQTSKFPKIRPNAGLRNLEDAEEGLSELPASPSKKVDLKDLTLEDRERVLRLLFAKINNVQGFVEALPAHPIAALSASGKMANAQQGYPPPPSTALAIVDSRPSSRLTQSQPLARGFSRSNQHTINATEWIGRGVSSPTMPGMA